MPYDTAEHQVSSNNEDALLAANNIITGIIQNEGVPAPEGKTNLALRVLKEHVKHGVEHLQRIITSKQSSNPRRMDSCLLAAIDKKYADLFATLLIASGGYSALVAHSTDDLHSPETLLELMEARNISTVPFRKYILASNIKKCFEDPSTNDEQKAAHIKDLINNSRLFQPHLPEVFCFREISALIFTNAEYKKLVNSESKLGEFERYSFIFKAIYEGYPLSLKVMLDAIGGLNALLVHKIDCHSVGSIKAIMKGRPEFADLYSEARIITSKLMEKPILARDVSVASIETITDQGSENGGTRVVLTWPADPVSVFRDIACANWPKINEHSLEECSPLHSPDSARSTPSFAPTFGVVTRSTSSATAPTLTAGSDSDFEFGSHCGSVSDADPASAPTSPYKSGAVRLFSDAARKVQPLLAVDIADVSSKLSALSASQESTATSGPSTQELVLDEPSAFSDPRLSELNSHQPGVAESAELSQQSAPNVKRPRMLG